MRIDLNPTLIHELGRSDNAVPAAHAGRANGKEATDKEDTVQLSTGSDALASLKAQLDGVPDIRQDKVQALRHALATGTYQVSPQAIAEAMIADLKIR